jgi:hypothetical protein
MTRALRLVRSRLLFFLLKLIFLVIINVFLLLARLTPFALLVDN